METAQAQYKPLRGHGAFVIEGLAADNTVFHAIRDTQLWEPHVIAAIEKVVKPDFVCLDVGANIGAITLPLASLASEGQVYAFEASPTAYELLSRNVATNGLENVTISNVAITDHSGDTAEIFFSNAELGCAHLSTRLGRTGTREEVRTLALHDLPDLWPVDFIKMDVEGGEIAALQGARLLLEECHPILVIEYNPVPAEWFTGSTSRRALYDVLTGLYPRIEIIGPDGTLDPVPDWEYLDQALTVHTWRDLLCTV